MSHHFDANLTATVHSSTKEWWRQLVNVDKGVVAPTSECRQSAVVNINFWIWKVSLWISLKLHLHMQV